MKKNTLNGYLISPLIFKHLQGLAFRKMHVSRILVLKNSKLVICGKNPFRPTCKASKSLNACNRFPLF